MAPTTTTALVCDAITQIKSACKVKCPKTCHYESKLSPCKDTNEVHTCKEGCECRLDHAWQGDRCVKEDQCSCYDESAKVRRLPYEKWTSGCKKCQCLENKVICKIDCSTEPCGEGLSRVSVAGECCPVCMKTTTPSGPITTTPEPTTTTTATTTVTTTTIIPACAIKEGMDNSLLIPSESIRSSPKMDDNNNIRPSSTEGWKIPLKEAIESKPWLEIDLVRNSETVNPVPVDRVKITGIPKFSVFYKRDSKSDKWTPYTENGAVKVFDPTDDEVDRFRPSFTAESIRIVFNIPLRGGDIVIKAEIFACFHEPTTTNSATTTPSTTMSSPSSSTVEATTSTGPMCPLIEGMGSNQPVFIPDSRISSVPADDGTPSLVKPTNEGSWTPTAKGLTKPILIVNLVRPDEKVQPIFVDSLDIIGNVKTFTVSYKADENSPSWTDVTEDGRLKEFDATSGKVTFKPTIQAEVIAVKLLQTTDDGEKFTVKAKIFACFHAEVSTTTATPTSVTTTTESTTSTATETVTTTTVVTTTATPITSPVTTTEPLCQKQDILVRPEDFKLQAYGSDDPVSNLYQLGSVWKSRTANDVKMVSASLSFDMTNEPTITDLTVDVRGADAIDVQFGEGDSAITKNVAITNKNSWTPQSISLPKGLVTRSINVVFHMPSNGLSESFIEVKNLKVIACYKPAAGTTTTISTTPISTTVTTTLSPLGNGCEHLDASVSEEKLEATSSVDSSDARKALQNSNEEYSVNSDSDLVLTYTIKSNKIVKVTSVSFEVKGAGNVILSYNGPNGEVSSPAQVISATGVFNKVTSDSKVIANTIKIKLSPGTPVQVKNLYIRACYGTQPETTTTAVKDQTQTVPDFGEPTTQPEPTCAIAGQTYGLCTCTLTCLDIIAGRGCNAWKSIADAQGKCCKCPTGQVIKDGSCVEEKSCICKDSESGLERPFGSSFVEDGTHSNCQKECVFSTNCVKKCTYKCSLSCGEGYKLYQPESGCCECIPTTTIPVTTTSGVCTCPVGAKACDNCTKCFTPDLVCDKRNDCSDMSDEKDCPCYTDGKTIKSGESFKKNVCSDCMCKAGISDCKKTCSITSCSDNQVLNLYANDEDKCCTCEDLATTQRPTTESSTTGTTTPVCKEGEKIVLNDCFSKLCQEGRWQRVADCNKKCGENQRRIVYETGACCACEEITTTMTTTTVQPTTTKRMCPAKLPFTVCIKACKFCHFMEPDCDETSKTTCISGCDCPIGQLLDGETCVPVADCSCRMSELNEALQVIYLSPSLN